MLVVNYRRLCIDLRRQITSTDWGCESKHLFQTSMTKRPTTCIWISLLAFLFVIGVTHMSAQQTSRGRDFYFSFLPNIHNNGTASDDSLYVYVIADSATTGTLTYKNRSGNLVVQNIVINNPAQIWQHHVQWAGYELLGYNQSQQFSNNNDLETAANQVFHVQTDHNVAVYALNKAVTTSDASLVLPTSLLGTDYYVLAYKADGVLNGFGGGLDLAYTPSEFVIVATDSNTNVTVVPTAPTTQTALATKTFTLQKGQAYLFQSAYSTTQLRYDLSGTHITSSKPVAVFAGHQRATIPVELRGNLVSRDHLYEELLPTSVWGRSYVITPLAQPQGITTLGNDLWRVVAQDDGTVLNFNNTQVAVLNRGQVYEAALNQAGLLVASKKVMVALYKKTHSSGQNLQPGDPFMMIIPPRRQYLTKYRYTNIQAFNSFTQQFITVVTTRSNISSITYDGARLNANFIDIPNTCFAYANINVTSEVHNIQSSQPVGLYVYGYGDADSYGYVGGMALQPDLAEVDVDAGPDRTVCAGDTVQLHLTGAASNIKWKPNSGINCDTCRDVIAQPTQTTTYIVSAIDSLGCDALDTVVVNVRKFQINAGRDTSLCLNGDSVTISATGLNGTIRKINWTPKTGLACDTCISTKAHPTQTTNYIAVAVDSIGCKGRDTVKVSIRPGLQVDAGPDQEFCSAADSVVLKATLGNGVIRSVQWTPKDGVGCDTCIITKVRPKGNTTYFVTVRDSLGCDGMDSVHVLLKSRSGNIHAIGSQFICFKNDSAALLVQGKIMSVKWTPSNGVTCDSCQSTFAKPSVTTTYYCRGLDAQGCIYEDSTKITVLPKATVSIQPDSIGCTSTGIALRADGNFTSIVWTPTTGLSCSNCPTPLAVPPKKDITYYARVRNGTSADCEAIDSVTVRYRPGIEGQLPTSVTVCSGDSLVYTLKYGGHVQWKPSTYLSCDTCLTVVIKPKANIKYTIEGDSSICTSRVTMDVKISQKSTLKTSGPKTICRGDSVLLDPTSSAQNNAVLWQPVIGLACPTCLNTMASPAKTTMYVVTSGTGACATKDSILVTVKDRPIASVAPADTSLCQGGNVHYNISSTGTSIRWSPATGLSCTDCPDPIASPSSTTTYTIQITGANGCDTTLSARIGIGTPPVFRLLNQDTALCEGSFVQTRVSDSSYSFHWSPETGVQCPTCAQTRIAPIGKDSTHRYILTAVNAASGCSTSDTLDIRVNAMPKIDSITPPTRICQKQSIQLYVDGGGSYQWSPASGLSQTDIQNPVATPESTLTYTVRVTTVAGCWKDTSVTISIAPCGDSLVITPNGSGASFIACDSTDASLDMKNLGQIALRIDSVSIWRVENGWADQVVLDTQNTKFLPQTLNPGESLSPAYRVRIFPLSAGPFKVVFRVHSSNGVRIDTVQFNAFGRKDDVVRLYLGSTSVSVDSSFVLPIFGESSKWAQLRVREVLAAVHFNPASLQYDTSKTVQLGDMLDPDWTVKYEPSLSSKDSAVFRAKGQSILSRNGTLMKPFFKTLLSVEKRSFPSLSYSLPSLRILCADERSDAGLVEIITCAADLRRVSLTTTSFRLISINPNPVSSGSVVVRYSVGFPCMADLRIYDESAKEIAVLVNGAHDDGVYEAQFDASLLSSGKYYCVYSAAGNQFSMPLILAR